MERPDDHGRLRPATLIVVNSGVNRAIRQSETVAMVLEGKPTVLARNGHLVDSALRQQGLRLEHVEVAARRQNATSVADVDTMTLEPGGTIVTVLKAEKQSATREDLARLEAKLDRLLARSS